MFLSTLELDNFSPFILEVPFAVNYYAKRILRQAQDWWRLARKSVNGEPSWNQRKIGLPFTACPEPVEGFTLYRTLCATCPG